MHIDNIDWVEFYAPAFQPRSGAAAFVERVTSLKGPAAAAKIALQQGGRMLWLADWIEEVAAGRDSIQIFFYLIAAEAVAKMVFGFKGEGQSRGFVRQFFGEVCLDRHRDCLSRALKLGPARFLNWSEAVDKLYDVRCDVAHEALHFDFHLKGDNQGLPRLTGLGLSKTSRGVVAHITLPELRRLVLEGVRKLLPSPSVS